MKDGWWYLSNPHATFLVLVKQGKLIEAPPYARRVWGKKIRWDRQIYLGES